MMTNPPLSANATKYELSDPIKPKPTVREIKAGLNKYYDSTATGFDEFNAKIVRTKYLALVDNLVASELTRRARVEHLLSIGAGTGAREISIRKQSGINYEITCIDRSAKMCAYAIKNGLRAFCDDFLEAALPEAHFDAALYLNAFECLVTAEERFEFFKKVHRLLKPGGVFFVDVMDIEDRSGWGEAIKEQYKKERLGEFGYEFGDYFFRRVDQDVVAFAHYSSYEEMKELLKCSGFSEYALTYINEQTGEFAEPTSGSMFFSAVKA